MLTLEQIRSDYRDDILALAGKHDLEDIRVFGSIARGDANENSDLDLLVSRKKGGDPWGIGGFYMDMQELFDCKVDIVMKGALHGVVGEKILHDAVEL